MRLPDPTRSRVLLIGVSTYQSAELPDVPAVRNNLDGLAAALTDHRYGGFAEASVLADPSSVRLTYRAIREQADLAEHTLLVYFAGHGLTGPRRGELYLALADTEPSELLVSALDFRLIREIFLDCAALNKVLILDCCFSGRATADFLAAPGDALLGEVEIAGTYIIASAPPNAVALARPGATHTAFTSELLSLLTKGIPDGPELLTLGNTYQHLRRTMTAKGLPEPGRRATDTTDLLALTRNPAYQAPRVDPPVPPHPVIATDTPETPVRLGLGMRLAIVLAGIGLIVLIMLIIFRDSPPNGPSGSLPNITTTVTATATTTTIPAVQAQNARNVPVRVFNNSTIPGLAARAAGDFRADGWTVAEVGNYSQGVIPSTTVYFRPGTEEESAANVFATKFSMQSAARFEGLSPAAPGLIVIVRNDYQGPKP